MLNQSCFVHVPRLQWVAYPVHAADSRSPENKYCGQRRSKNQRAPESPNRRVPGTAFSTGQTSHERSRFGECRYRATLGERVSDRVSRLRRRPPRSFPSRGGFLPISVAKPLEGNAPSGGDWQTMNLSTLSMRPRRPGLENRKAGKDGPGIDARSRYDCRLKAKTLVPCAWHLFPCAWHLFLVPCAWHLFYAGLIPTKTEVSVAPNSIRLLQKTNDSGL